MTTAAALHLLGLHPAATMEETGRAYAQRRSELAASEVKAPTPGLKAKYAQQMTDLDAAFAVAMQAILHPQNLPSLQPAAPGPEPGPPRCAYPHARATAFLAVLASLSAFVAATAAAFAASFAWPAAVYASTLAK